MTWRILRSMVRKQNAPNEQDVVLPDVRIPDGMGVLNPVADTVRGQLNMIGGVLYERPDR